MIAATADGGAEIMCGWLRDRWGVPWQIFPEILPRLLADPDPAVCSITSSHGVVNGVTQDFRNNPNGYRPLYVAAESQIHAAAARDQALLAAGEQSTRTMLAQVLGVAGVKKVTVDFS